MFGEFKLEYWHKIFISLLAYVSYPLIMANFLLIIII